MANPTAGFRARPSGPILGGASVLFCVVVPLFGLDRVETAYHRPLCDDTCGSVGADSRSISNGGRFLNRTIRCTCSDGRVYRRDIAWREYLDWTVGQVLAVGAMLGLVAVVRSSWRRARSRLD